jgi:hypothetical protein
MRKEALMILEQWYDADPYSRNMISENLCMPELIDVSEEIIRENNKIFKSCDLIGTPSFFVNGYMLPYQYDIDDINLFSEVFPFENKFVVEGIVR